MSAGHRPGSPSLGRPWPAVAAVPARVRPRATRVAISAATARPRPVSALVADVRVADGHLSLASDRRRHQHGHRHSLATCPGHQPSGRALAPEAADGQSADRSRLVPTSSTLPQRRPPAGSVTAATGATWSARLSHQRPDPDRCDQPGSARLSVEWWAHSLQRAGDRGIPSRVSGGMAAMSKYAVFFTLKGEAIAQAMEQPSDRVTVVSKAVESAGGKLEAYYLMFGQYDGFVIVDLPDSRAAAATSLAVSSTGAFEHLETHELIEAEDLNPILEQAKGITSQLPGT